MSSKQYRSSLTERNGPGGIRTHDLSNNMIPTIQVTTAIYQELFKLTRLGEDRGRESDGSYFILQNYRAKTANHF
jgi:hypothetical protein